MADQEIKTSIDGLVTYLNEHGETNVSAVAAALGVSESVIIGWATVLENAGIIRITYRSGRAFLSQVSKTGERAAETGHIEQSRLETQIDSQTAIVGQVGTKLDEYNKTISGIDELFRNKYKNVKGILDKLNEVESHIEGIEKRISTRNEKIKEVSDKAQEEFDNSQKYLANLSGFSINTNNANAVVQELHDLLKTYEKNTVDLSKALESTIYQYRKSATEISKTIREKHDQLRDTIAFENKQLEEYDRLANDYKRKYEGLARHTQDTSKQIKDDVAKGAATMASLSKTAEGQINAIRAKVDDIKKDLGGISGLNATLVVIKKDLADAEKQKAEIMETLKKMQQQVRALDSTKKPSDRSTIINQVNEAGKGVTKSSAELREKMDNVNKNLHELKDGKGDDGPVDS